MQFWHCSNRRHDFSFTQLPVMLISWSQKLISQNSLIIFTWDQDALTSSFSVMSVLNNMALLVQVERGSMYNGHCNVTTSVTYKELCLGVSCGWFLHLPFPIKGLIHFPLLSRFLSSSLPWGWILSWNDIFLWHWDKQLWVFTLMLEDPEWWNERKCLARVM